MTTVMALLTTSTTTVSSVFQIPSRSRTARPVLLESVMQGSKSEAVMLDFGQTGVHVSAILNRVFSQKFVATSLITTVTPRPTRRMMTAGSVSQVKMKTRLVIQDLPDSVDRELRPAHVARTDSGVSTVNVVLTS
jgi:hypothetical protein